MVVLVWHTDSNTLTLIKEFAPGREEVSYGVVAGMYEKNKHDSPLQAAKYEVSQTATLQSHLQCRLPRTAPHDVDSSQFLEMTPPDLRH